MAIVLLFYCPYTTHFHPLNMLPNTPKRHFGALKRLFSHLKRPFSHLKRMERFVSFTPLMVSHYYFQLSQLSHKPVTNPFQHQHTYLPTTQVLPHF